MFAHIAQQRAIPSPLSASAHMVAAWAAAEQDSMHDCIIVMSISIAVIFGMAFIMSVIIMSMLGSLSVAQIKGRCPQCYAVLRAVREGHGREAG
jgi:hypothetical protein